MVGGILIGCEYSAIVRDAFRARGFDGWSCDLKRTEGDPRFHIQGDIRDAIRSRDWLAIILHIECTAMAVCGNKHYARGTPGWGERVEAVEWSESTVRLALSVAPYVAVENPASVIFPALRNRLNADVQYIHPWEHGHPEQKKTGLALWGLPRIVPTNNVHAQMMALPRKDRERIFFMSPGADRGHERSRFYPGFANAFARQWGDFLLTKDGSSLPPPPVNAKQQTPWSEGAAYPRPLNCAGDDPTPPVVPGAFQTPCHESGFYAVSEA